MKWLEIDLGAIRNNISIIKKKIGWPKVKLMAVVKANAYGHGLIEVARICQKEKVDYLAVASVDEGLKLRNNKLKLPILVMGYIDKEQIKEAVKSNLSLSIYDLEEAGEIKKVCLKLKRQVKVHLKLDSGMHRLGFAPQDFIKALRDLLNDDCFIVEYFYSHFADIQNKNYSNQQIKILEEVLREINKENNYQPKVHFSRSASLNWSKTHYDMVRPGLAIYGLEKSLPELKSALSFKAKIVQVKEIQKGDFVGYCLTFKALKNMKIATIGVGYADGYGRNLSNKGEVLIKGVRCPVIGRVCMNLTIVDVSKVDNPKMGDEVVLIGKSHKEEISAFRLAETIDTIPYEIVSRIPAEIPKIYKK